MSKTSQRASYLPITAIRFAPAIFLSAFLVFQVQPLVSKHILPWYGGTPAVWTTCLLFFQSVLFAGYAYAHLSVSKLRRRWQAALHVLLLIAAVLLPILPGNAWKPDGSEYPILRIVSMLLASVGLPFFVLCASSPLLQAWFSRLYSGRSPYHLFAVSNAGALLALISYPFVIEPRFSVTEQSKIWSWIFCAFIVLFGSIAWSVWKAASQPSTPAKHVNRTGDPGLTAATQPTLLNQGLWILLAACGVILFMSVTNQLTLNIAAVPFLWVMPLSIYLLSFIFAFNGPRWYSRRLYSAPLVGAFAVFFLLLPGELAWKNAVLEISLIHKIIIYAIALFVCCMVCHGELYRIKPAPAHLTRYYLTISFGGALGGVLVGVIAPRAFLLFQELQLGLLLCCILYLTSIFKDPKSVLRGGRPRWAWVVMGAGFVVMAGLSYQLSVGQLKDIVYKKRNFFGLLRVEEMGKGDSRETHSFALQHGSTLHGIQIVGPKQRKLPTTYFGPVTGVGVLMANYESPGGRRIGIIGMGIATLAAYGRPGDHIRFYELNPDVVEIARKNFHYLEDSRAKWDVQLGDARLSLEEEPDQQFDILVLDAFNSDAIPVHLLTLEAMEIYARHLQPQGVIAVHVTNVHLHLDPVVYNLANAKQFYALGISNKPLQTSFASRWILLSRDRETLLEIGKACEPLRESGVVQFSVEDAKDQAKVRTWTDDFSSLFPLMH